MIPIQDKGETKAAEHMIEDIIWYYKSALNVEKTKEMFAPFLREWAEENYSIPQSSLKEEKVFFIDEVLGLLNKWANKQMSVSKLTEILNEKHNGYE